MRDDVIRGLWAAERLCVDFFGGPKRAIFRLKRDQLDTKWPQLSLSAATGDQQTKGVEKGSMVLLGGEVCARETCL